MLKRQLPVADKRAVIKLEKEGVLEVFNGTPEEERAIMVNLLFDEGCPVTEIPRILDHQVAGSCLIRDLRKK